MVRSDTHNVAAAYSKNKITYVVQHHKSSVVEGHVILNLMKISLIIEQEDRKSKSDVAIMIHGGRIFQKQF